jgi:putative FmdB family regulatory protein
MPTYEYRCNACKREFEYQQRMTEDDKVTCESCGKDALERLISRTAFQFKGGGWYKDLYSSAKPESGGDKKEAAPAAAPASTDSSSSSTPASTPSSSTGSSSTGSGGSTSGSGSSGSSSSASVS